MDEEPGLLAASALLQVFAELVRSCLKAPERLVLETHNLWMNGMDPRGVRAHTGVSRVRKVQVDVL